MHYTSPDPVRFSANSWQFEFDEDGTPNKACCLHGHPLDLEPGRKPGRFIVRVSATSCSICHHQLRQQEGKDTDQPIALYFNKEKAHLAQRRKHLADFLENDKNPRAAIEATVRELTCRLHRPKLRVRGRHRVSMVLLASATMCNLRRIWKYQQTDTFRARSLPHFLSNSLVNDLFAVVFPFSNGVGLDLAWHQFQILFGNDLICEPLRC